MDLRKKSFQKLCPSCGSGVNKMKVEVFYLKPFRAETVTLDKFWCGWCRKPVSRPVVTKPDNGHAPLSKPSNGNGKVPHYELSYDSFVPFHSFSRGRKVDNRAKGMDKSGQMSFRELWTCKRSRPPQKPRNKFFRLPTKREMVEDVIRREQISFEIDSDFMEDLTIEEYIHSDPLSMEDVYRINKIKATLDQVPRSSVVYESLKRDFLNIIPTRN